MTRTMFSRSSEGLHNRIGLSLSSFYETNCLRFFVGILVILFWIFQSKGPVTFFNVDQKDFSQLNLTYLLEAYSEPNRTSKMELFAKLVKGFQQLNFFAQSSILDIWLGSECSSIFHNFRQRLFIEMF